MSVDTRPTADLQRYLDRVSEAFRPRARALGDVLQERFRQELLWGEQNHPNGTSAKVFAKKRDLMRDLTDARAAKGKVSYLDILFEEVYEAAAEEDPVKLREELVQVAAVTVGWIETIDRGKQPA